MWQVLDNIKRSPSIRVSDHGITAVVLQAVANMNNNPSRLSGSHSFPKVKGTAFNYLKVPRHRMDEFLGCLGPVARAFSKLAVSSDISLL